MKVRIIHTFSNTFHDQVVQCSSVELAELSVVVIASKWKLVFLRGDLSLPFWVGLSCVKLKFFFRGLDFAELATDSFLVLEIRFEVRFEWVSFVLAEARWVMLVAHFNGSLYLVWSFKFKFKAWILNLNLPIFQIFSEIFESITPTPNHRFPISKISGFRASWVLRIINNIIKTKWKSFW